MNDITLTTEFVNRRQLLESAIWLLQGVTDGLIQTDSRQFAALEIAIRYLHKLQKTLAEK